MTEREMTNRDCLGHDTALQLNFCARITWNLREHNGGIRWRNQVLAWWDGSYQIRGCKWFCIILTFTEKIRTSVTPWPLIVVGSAAKVPVENIIQWSKGPWAWHVGTLRYLLGQLIAQAVYKNSRDSASFQCERTHDEEICRHCLQILENKVLKFPSHFYMITWRGKYKTLTADQCCQGSV